MANKNDRNPFVVQLDKKTDSAKLTKKLQIMKAVKMQLIALMMKF